MRPYLRVANVYEDRLDLSDVMEMNFTPEEYEIYRLEPGDILLNEGQSLEWVGRPAMFKGELPGACFQNTLVRFRAFQAVDPSYALLVFRGYLHTGRFQKIARWTVNIAHLGAARFAELEFPLPPLPEQRRIVAEIDRQFSLLDAGVAALKRVQAKLKRYRASVLQAACTGRLVPTEAELARAEGRSYERADMLLDRVLRGNGRAASRTDQQTTQVSSTPEGWTWATVDQVSEFTRYGSSARTSDDTRGVPVLRMGNLQEGRIDPRSLKYLPKTHHEFPDLFLRQGDLLFNRTNSAELVGKSAVYEDNPVPCSYASYLIAVRLLPSCQPHYLCYFINSPAGRAWVKTVVSQQVGQANVNGSKLRSLRFPMPPLGEQERIVLEVERQLSLIQQIETAVTANLRRAERLRQSILKRAFAGELVPQDPEDEPASVLLERIHLERSVRRNGTASYRRAGSHRPPNRSLTSASQLSVPAAGSPLQ